MSKRFIAFVEADAGIAPKKEFDSPEEAREYIEDKVLTGDLGPPKVRSVEPFNDS